MAFERGQRIYIVGKIVHLYHADREEEYQSASVQLADGQGVMTNLRNLRLADADPEPTEPEPELPPALASVLEKWAEERREEPEARDTTLMTPKYEAQSASAASGVAAGNPPAIEEASAEPKPPRRKKPDAAPPHDSLLAA